MLQGCAAPQVEPFLLRDFGKTALGEGLVQEIFETDGVLRMAPTKGFRVSSNENYCSLTVSEYVQFRKIADCGLINFVDALARRLEYHVEEKV